MKVYVLTRIDKVDIDIENMMSVPTTERIVIGVYPTRHEATTEGFLETQWRGADDYDVEEFDL